MPKSAIHILIVIVTVSIITACANSQDQKSADYKNTLKWSTASENRNFAYDIYRSQSVDGPFERISLDPVLGAGTTNLIHHYQFTDRQIDPYRVYFYYIESISEDGERRRFSPIKKSNAKLTKADGPK